MGGFPGFSFWVVSSVAPEFRKVCRYFPEMVVPGDSIQVNRCQFSDCFVGKFGPLCSHFFIFDRSIRRDSCRVLQCSPTVPGCIE